MENVKLPDKFSELIELAIHDAGETDADEFLPTYKHWIKIEGAGVHPPYFSGNVSGCILINTLREYTDDITIGSPKPVPKDYSIYGNDIPHKLVGLYHLSCGYLIEAVQSFYWNFNLIPYINLDYPDNQIKSYQPYKYNLFQTWHHFNQHLDELNDVIPLFKECNL